MSDSDPQSLITLGTHVGGGLGSGGLGAWLMHLFKSRKEDEERKERAAMDQATAITLAQLSGKMDQLIADVREHKQVFTDVVTHTNAIKALGEKLDDIRDRVERIEEYPVEPVKSRRAKR